MTKMFGDPCWIMGVLEMKFVISLTLIEMVLITFKQASSKCYDHKFDEPHVIMQEWVNRWKLLTVHIVTKFTLTNTVLHKFHEVIFTYYLKIEIYICQYCLNE